MTDPQVLVEPVTPPKAFDDEMEEVRAGRKPMITTSFPGEMLENRELAELLYDEYLEFILQAAKADLLVVLDPQTFFINGGPYLNMRVLVVRREQAWRIPAYQTLDRAFQDKLWSDGAEAIRSELLGYSDRDIEEWLRYRNHTNSGWGIATIYGVLTGNQRDQLKRLGMRSMTEQVVREVRWFEVREQFQLRRDAHTLCEQDAAVCRVGMAWEQVMKMTSKQRSSPDAPIVYLEELVSMTEWNEALRSRVEVWTEHGWR